MLILSCYIPHCKYCARHVAIPKSYKWLSRDRSWSINSKSVGGLKPVLMDFTHFLTENLSKDIKQREGYLFFLCHVHLFANSEGAFHVKDDCYDIVNNNGLSDNSETISVKSLKNML